MAFLVSTICAQFRFTLYFQRVSYRKKNEKTHQNKALRSKDTTFHAPCLREDPKKIAPKTFSDNVEDQRQQLANDTVNLHAEVQQNHVCKLFRVLQTASWATNRTEEHTLTGVSYY